MKKPSPDTFQQLKKIVLDAGFPQNKQKIHDILEAAFKQIDENLKSPYFLHKGTRPTRELLVRIYPKGSAMNQRCVTT